MPNEDVISSLHRQPHRGVFHITGGGSMMLPDLLKVPGASGTVIEATIPYAESSLSSLLGSAPDQACSAETARDLAMCAFLRAKDLEPGQDRFGFAITASLRTVQQKKGEHRAYFALQTYSHTYTWSLRLAKGLRNRQEEERLLADVCLAEFARAFDLAYPRPALTDEDVLHANIAESDDHLQALLVGKRQIVGRRRPKAIFPGAFNPIHDGHRRMAAVAARRLGTDVAYEICIRNVDKPPLNFYDMRQRRTQFDEGEVWLTNTPTFVEKARAFGAVTFVVGTDTVSRIADPKYYEDGALNEAIDELSDVGCRFLVFGRKEGQRFVTLDDLTLPKKLRALCDGVRETEFRSDLSSSFIRKQGLRQATHG